MGSFDTEFRMGERKSGKPNGQIQLIDFAKSAEGYGVKTYSVRTVGQLHEALEDGKKQTTSTLIDIKVLPKTMTNSYESWWNVSGAEVSEKEEIVQVYKELQGNRAEARRY